MMKKLAIVLSALATSIIPAVAQVTSVSNSDSTLTLSPNPITTTGTISLNLGEANTWSATQTFGNITLLQAAEQIGGPSATIPVNSDDYSAFLIQGTINPTATPSYTQDSVEVVKVTNAPTAGDPTGLDSEQHQITFDGCATCTSNLSGGNLGQLAGHSNQLTIASTWAATGIIPLVSSYNPGALVNNAGVNAVQKYVLYDSPSGQYAGINGSTLASEEFDGVLIFGPTDIPGVGGTMSLYDFRGTVPAAAPTASGSTENVYGFYLSGSCGSASGGAT